MRKCVTIIDVFSQYTYAFSFVQLLSFCKYCSEIILILNHVHNGAS